MVKKASIAVRSASTLKRILLDLNYSQTIREVSIMIVRNGTNTPLAKTPKYSVDIRKPQLNTEVIFLTTVHVANSST